MNDHDLLLAIQAILNAGEWSPDTPQDIAELMAANGYPIADLDEDAIDDACSHVQLHLLQDGATGEIDQSDIDDGGDGRVY